MENKFTDDEIIKALGCCGKGFGNCEGCPYDDDYHDCVTNDGKTLIMQDCIDLINRQKAEIERLNVELVGMRGACESYKIHYDNAKAEVERLNNEEKALLYTVEGMRKERRRLQTILVNFMDEVYEWGNKNNVDTNNFAQIAILGIERDSAVQQIKYEARKEFGELIKQSTTDKSIDELLEEMEGEEVG